MKTIEQESSIFAHKKINSIPDSHIETLPKSFVMAASIDGFKAGVEFAQRWIPVEEELPVFNKTEYPNGNYETFFVKILTGSMSPIVRYGAAHLVNDKRWSCEWDWNVVTHWRQIEYK